MTTLQTAIMAANAWVVDATPIIRAYLALDDVSLINDICANHYGRTLEEKQRTSAYREAQGYVTKAQDALYDMLDGIRDNFICDHNAPYPRDMSEDDIIAADEFNEELGRSVVSVEAAVKAVGDGL